MRFLSNLDMELLLDMPGCLDALRTGYRDLMEEQAAFIPRIDLYAPTGQPERWYGCGIMTGLSRSYGVLACRIKSDVLYWTPERTEEKYCVRPGLFSGVVLLYAIDNGEPLALIQDGYVQHLRVGGTCGLGAEVLAREDATVIGLLGSGGMARTCLTAVATVRPPKLVRVFSPTAANRKKFAAEMSEVLGVEVTAIDSPREAIEGADIVLSATDATQPTFDPNWVSDGAHVAFVRATEIDHRMAERADVVAQFGMATIPNGTPVPGMRWMRDGMAAFVAAREDAMGALPVAQRYGEGRTYLLDILSGRHPGRSRPDQITLFVNSGTQGLQFAAVCGHAFRRAVESGVGTTIPDGWFLQDIRD